MEVRPERGVSLIALPNRKVALVMVEIIGTKTAARMAKALVAGTMPTVNHPKPARKAKG